MVRTRTGWLAAFVALGLVAGACKKEEKKTAEGTTGTTAAPTGETKAVDNKGPGLAVQAANVASGDDLSLLPADSEVVLGLNFAQLQQSALWKQFSPALMAKAASGLNDFKTACGFDPMEAIKSVSLGMKGLGGSTPDGIVVIHGPDKGKVTGCLDKAKAEAAKNGGEITQDGDVFMVKDKHGANTAWTFVGNETLIGAVGPSASKATLVAAAKGGSPLKSSKTFVEMFSKINTKESLWVLVNGNAPFMAQAAKAGVKPKAVFGSVNVTDGLSVDMRIRLATPEEATNLVKLAQQQTGNPQVKNMFDKLDVGADGSDVKFSVAMSQQKLTALMGMVGGALGSMMGGGGGMGGGMGGP